ncbi:MAG: trigger factor [Planctomycetota bacterium]
MPFAVETLGACVRRVRLEVAPDEVGRAIDEELKKLSRQVSMPGFRQGKVPRSMLERKYGESVRAEVKEHLLSHAYEEAIKAHHLHPVEPPPINPGDVKESAEGSVQVEFEVEVRPEFELLGYKNLKVSAPATDVTEAEVGEGIERLRQNLASVTPVEGQIEKTDLLLVDLKYALLDGSSFTHGERIVNLAAELLDQTKVQNLAQSFFGKMIGDTVRLSITLPEQFEPKEHAGRTAAVDVVIHKAQRIVVPEMNAAFLAQVGAASEAELQTRMRERIQRAKQDERNRMLEEQCLDLLVDRHEFELPQRLLERVELEQMEHFRSQMRGVETPAEEIERRVLEFDGRNKELARKRLKARFILDRIAEEEKTEVTQDELQAALRHVAEMAGEQAAEVLEHYKDRDHLGALALDVRRGKVRSLLRMSAEVVELEKGPEPAAKKEAPAS